MEEEKKTKKENVAAGIVGAFLGSLIGVLCTVVIGQMGYVASISGLVMAVCALKGYEMLSGGTLSKKGAVVSSVLVLVMTWFAHRLSWAVAIAISVKAGVFECFRAIPGLLDVGALEGAAYWGDLALLYLFTLLGAVPTILAGLRGADLPDLPQNATAASAAQEGEAAQAEFYPGTNKWMRGLRFSASGAILVGLLPTIVLMFAAFAQDYASQFILGSLGCLAGCIIMMCPALAYVPLCNKSMFLLVRVKGTLWLVKMGALNVADTYRFTKKIGFFQAIHWDMLNEEERERAKTSVLRAVDLLSSGQVMPGSTLGMAVTPLTDLQIEKETKWAWKGTYALANGKRKRISIPKSYPNFAPVPELEPAQGPVPAHWGLLIGAVALTAVLGFVGMGFGAMLDGPVPGFGPASSTPALTPTPAPAASEPPQESKAPEVDPKALFHVAEELGYEYTAEGYIKAPVEMYGQEGYLNVHVPYSDTPEYLSDGYGIRSGAHGMEVTVTIAWPYESAQAVVDAAYEALKERGTDIMEDNVSETAYYEEYDIAIKQVYYFEEDRTKVRMVLLYADYKQEGYYLNAAILYRPELFDEDYPALLTELGDAYSLNLPEIPPMDQA